MEASRDYFSMSAPKRSSADDISWEHWHKSLALWDLQYALESPSSQGAHTPGQHPHRQNLVIPRQSPAAMFSPSTFSDASLNSMNNYMDNMSPIIASEEVMGMAGIDGYTSYSQLLERDSCVRPPLPHHGSSPAMLYGYPIAPPQSHQQVNGLGLGYPIRHDDRDDGSNSSNNPSPGRWEDIKPIINSNRSATPSSVSPQFALPSNSPGSKRSSVNISNGDDLATPESRVKRISMKSRHGHSRSMTENSSSEPASRTAKLAHNIVERNYRDRLNDQIAELSSYLFDFSTESKARSRPPKSLVISRAKERLMELTSHNEELLTQVTQLKQQIAVLDHIVSATGGVDRANLALLTQRQSGE